MITLADRMHLSPASATVALADLASDLRDRGADVLDFSAGRAPEPTPAFINQAAATALMAGDTHQTPAQGRATYREACAQKLARDNGITADPVRSLIATLGCKHGLLLTLMATVGTGDEVLVEDPCFVSYGPTIAMCGGVAVPVPLRSERQFRWTPENLEGAITDRTKAILFCSPHNPTGSVHTESDLSAIADVARRHDLLVIADETYERLTWGGRQHRSIASLPGMSDRTVTLMGLTKSYGMGGWRIGFAHAPEPLIGAMVTIQQHLMTCASSFAQAGATVALASPAPTELEATWRDWEARCAFVTSELDRLPGVACQMPEGGFYAWIDVRDRGRPSAQMATELLEAHHVVLVPGSAFGPSGEGYLRMTAVKGWEDLRRGLTRLRQGLS